MTDSQKYLVGIGIVIVVVALLALRIPQPMTDAYVDGPVPDENDPDPPVKMEDLWLTFDDEGPIYLNTSAWYAHITPINVYCSKDCVGVQKWNASSDEWEHYVGLPVTTCTQWDFYLDYEHSYNLREFADFDRGNYRVKAEVSNVMHTMQFAVV